mmetsp:Transcript_8056/g.29825  ORF Transcript_8056/g.29825 Transcript_8056/m.29825 type:complete len:218 (-) Transcript_8056:1011-1664(-)
MATGISNPSFSYRTRATSLCNCRNAPERSATRSCARRNSSRSRSIISFVPSAGRSCNSFTVCFKFATSCSLKLNAVNAFRIALDACDNICCEDAVFARNACCAASIARSNSCFGTIPSTTCTFTDKLGVASMVVMSTTHLARRRVVSRARCGLVRCVQGRAPRGDDGGDGGDGITRAHRTHARERRGRHRMARERAREFHDVGALERARGCADEFRE